MPHIGVIATNRHMHEKLTRLASEQGMADSVILRRANLNDAIIAAREMEALGVEVIVSRGTVIELLHNAGVTIPIVNIRVSVQDIAEILKKARRLTGLQNPRIGFITYASLGIDMEALADLLALDLRCHQGGNSLASLEAAVAKAVVDADVIVGGHTVQQILEKQSAIPFIMHESGYDSLRQALGEARLIAYARALERDHTLRFKAIVDESRDGILMLEPDGAISLANPAAASILQYWSGLEGKRLAEVLPVPDLEARLASGKGISGEIINAADRSLVLNITPIAHQGHLRGAVVTFQPAERIEAIEERIRKARAAKGMTAHFTFEDIRGVSPQIRETLALARRYAATGKTVLLTGETGTGKELFAHALHHASPYHSGAFVAVNCAALPPTLLESEFFGYKEGAFTGASRQGKKGLFEMAHKGTIFLDEVSALNHYGQIRLLRVLQERSVLRLGSDKYIPVDFQLVAATNVDLQLLVARGRFRRDLFYRLFVLPLAVPPLRERQGDIRFLANVFLAREASPGKRPRLDEAALDALEQHAWPGNIRELEYCIQRLCATCAGGVISAAAVRNALPGASAARGTPGGGCDYFPGGFPGDFSSGFPGDFPGDFHGGPPGRERQLPRPPSFHAAREEVLHALRQCAGNQRRAAELLGIDSSTLYRRMKRLEIDKKYL